MPKKARETAAMGGHKSALDRLDAIFDECAGSLLVQRGARVRAQKHAQSQLEAARGATHSIRFAQLEYAADLVIAHAVELAARGLELTRLAKQLEMANIIPRVPLAKAVLQAPELLRLPTGVGIEVELGLLRAFVEANAISLWASLPDRKLRRLAHAGESAAMADDARRTARRLLGDERVKSGRSRHVVGFLIERGPRPSAAVVAHRPAIALASRRMILDYAGSMLTAMLERDELLARSHESGKSVVASAERRLSRLRFDLHDGPQQDVVLLAEDVRLLRDQLEGVLSGRRDKGRVLGRLDDLEARLVAIDGDLRRISAFVESPFLYEEALAEALGKLTDEFAVRTGIRPVVKLDGEFGELTDSQQITLLGLIREALSNIREHSDAQNVTIAISSSTEGVDATVTDDGQGFDPETTLIQAARAGHLGLVGMHERVQFLGGQTEIDSRPGGPTVISVRLPRYSREPAAGEIPV